MSDKKSANYDRTSSIHSKVGHCATAERAKVPYKTVSSILEGHSSVLYWISYYIISYRIVPYRIVSYHILLYHIILFYIF